MNRLLVSLLAAFDAVIVVAVGLAIVLAPVTLLWVFGPSGEPEWAALWPVGATVWQLGHFAPVAITLPAEFTVLAGISADGAAFDVSLAPTALAVFTAAFAWRSGSRAARAGAWPTGVLSGTAVVAALSTLIALTSSTTVATVDLAAAIAAPTLVFFIPAFLGAAVRAWNEGDDGLMDALSERLPDDVQNAVDAAARGLAICLAGFVAVGAVILAVLFAARGGEIVALTQAAHVDLLGLVMLSLGALLYLPTLVVWFAGFAAGPGFALGAGTAVSPAGTSLGVIPGIPVLGVIPESASTWMLLLALVLVAIGALAGWVARSLLLIGDAEPLRPRIVALTGVAVGSGAGAAALAWAAQGSLGPGRLAHVGPDPWWIGLAVLLEVGAGAAAVLLSPTGPRRREEGEATAPADQAAPPVPSSAASAAAAREPASPDEHPTAPLD